MQTKKYNLNVGISIIVLAIFGILIFYTSIPNARFLKEVERAFQNNSNQKALLSEVITSDWDRVCVDTAHMPSDIILDEMRSVSNYQSPLFRNSSPFYVGAVYFIKNKEIVDKYVFNTGGRSIDLKPISIKIGNANYHFFAESFFEDNACQNREAAKFVTYVDKSFGETYRKIIFTSK